MVRRSLWIVPVLALAAANVGLAQVPFVRTYLVTAGNSPTANGNALQVALANITNNSSTNPWLVKVEAGAYDLGSGSLTMKDYVDIEGSGPGVTTITSTACGGGANIAVVNIPASVHAELRYLTVQNTCADASGITTHSSNSSLYRVNVLIPTGSVQTIGILTEWCSPTIAKVNIQLSSSNNADDGILIVGGSPLVKDATIALQNTSAVSSSAGILIFNGSATIDGVAATVSGAQNNWGIVVQAGGASVVSNSRFTVTGGTTAYGLYALQNSSPTFNSVTATAIGGLPGGGTFVGLYNGGATVQLNNSTVIGNQGGFTAFGYGLESNGSNTAITQVNQSTIQGSFDGIALFNGTVRVGASQVSGGAGFLPGTTLTCANDYSGSYTPLNATCQ